MDAEGIIAALRRLGVPHERIAAAIHRDRTVATKMLRGGRKVQIAEIPALLDLISEYEREAGEHAEIVRRPQVPGADSALVMDYVSVEVLPTYAGMGGGGTGEGGQVTALLPRQLVQDELHAKPDDLLVINLRGDSMEPLFLHGDQVVIDKRDRNPVQPGPFALWYDDGYVVKNVERRVGKYRIFSSNKIYSEDLVDPSDVTIMGRPVWYARRL